MQNYYTSSLEMPNFCYNHCSAEIAVSFIKMLNTQTLDIWQEKFIRDIFGIETSNGNRQFIHTYAATNDKQKRLLFLTQIALFLTCADRSPNSNVYLCVAGQEQSAVIFKNIYDIIDRCENLHRYIELSLCQKKFIYKPLNSSFQIIAPNKYELLQNAHGILIEESLIYNDCCFLDLENISRRTHENQPLFVVTASAQTSNKNKFFYSLHQKAVNILNTKDINSTFYSLINT